MKAKRISAWMLAAFSMLLASLVIAECAGIYCKGVSPENLTESGVLIRDIYSRTRVYEAFTRIAWAFYAWAACLTAALVCRCPVKSVAREAMAVSAQARLALIKARVEATAEMKREENARRLARLAYAFVCAACAFCAGGYLLDFEHFASRELETVMGDMLRHVAPWAAVAFAGGMILAELDQRSVLRELKAAKTAEKRQSEAAPVKQSRLVPLLRGALLAAAAVFIVLGVCNGGMRDVLVKAINICTECVGLG